MASFSFPEDGSGVPLELDDAYFGPLDEFLGTLNGQCKMLILDGLQRGLPGGVKETDESALKYIFKRLTSLAQKHKLAVLITHHVRKTGLYSHQRYFRLQFAWRAA